MTSVAIPSSKHAPGWKWRARDAGQLDRPLGWVKGDDAYCEKPFPDAGQTCNWLPASINGLCESGWHADCAQAPLAKQATSSQCACPCHQPQGVLL